MSEMNLIMENWRGYLNEAPTPCSQITVGEFKEAWALMSQLKGKNRREVLDKLQSMGDWAMGLSGAAAALGVLTGGTAVAAGGAAAAGIGLGSMIIGAIRSKRGEGKARKEVIQVLSLLCIDPSFLDILEDNLEEEYLKSGHLKQESETIFNDLDDTDRMPDLNQHMVAWVQSKYLQRSGKTTVKDTRNDM